MSRWYLMEILREKSLLARDSNPRPSDPHRLVQLTSLHYGTVRHLLSRTVGPNLVATSLWGSAFLAQSPATDFWHEPEVPRVCPSKRVGVQLLLLQPRATRSSLNAHFKTHCLGIFFELVWSPRHLHCSYTRVCSLYRTLSISLARPGHMSTRI